MAQAAAFGLRCPLSFVNVADTSSLSSPGSLGTGGSATSECVVKAVLDAAVKLCALIDPYRKPPKSPWESKESLATPACGTNFPSAITNAATSASPSNKITMDLPEPPCASEWTAAVAAAAAAGTSLQASGWFGGASAGPGVGYDYATQGVACCEVEVDCLSGEVAMRRADLLMDQVTEGGQIRGRLSGGRGIPPFAPLDDANQSNACAAKFVLLGAI